MAGQRSTSSTTPPAGDDAQVAASTPDATTAPSDAASVDLAAQEQTTLPPSGTTADGSPSPAADPGAAPTVRVLSGNTGVADGIPEGDKVPRPQGQSVPERTGSYAEWQAGQPAPEDAYRVYDAAGNLGAVQSAPPAPGESGVIVARKGDVLTGGAISDLTR